MLACSRRVFLQRTLFCAAALALPSPFATLAAATPPMPGQKRVLVVGAQEMACLLDLDRHVLSTIPIGFKPHSFVQHPARPERVFAISKWSEHAVELDVKRQQVVRQIRAPEPMHFYGHAMFSAQGDRLFISGVDSKTGLGHLLGYRSDGDKPELRYQVTPGKLHECQMLADNTAWVASMGYREGATPDQMVWVEPSALIRVNMANGQILERKAIGDRSQGLSHMHIAGDGTLITNSIPQLAGQAAAPLYPGSNPLQQMVQTKTNQQGAVYISRGGSEGLKRVDWPPQLAGALDGEMLSLAIDEARHLAAISNPDSGHVLFVDLKTATYRGHIADLASPQALAFVPEQNKFICNNTLWLDAKTLQATPLSFTMAAGAPLVAKSNSSHSLLIALG